MLPIWNYFITEFCVEFACFLAYRIPRKQLREGRGLCFRACIDSTNIDRSPTVCQVLGIQCILGLQDDGSKPSPCPHGAYGLLDETDVNQISIQVTAKLSVQLCGL